MTVVEFGMFMASVVGYFAITVAALAAMAFIIVMLVSTVHGD